MFRHVFAAAIVVFATAGASAPLVRSDLAATAEHVATAPPVGRGFTGPGIPGPDIEVGAELPAARRFLERFPDPAVLLVGSTYYAYATRNGPLNIQVSTSKDLVYWSTPVNALPAVPEWAQVRTWAPAVIQRDSAYVMWYTTRDRASQRQCISVATAADPLGPFIDRSTAPAICQVDRGGSIDPEVFTDASGASYLLWKSDDNAIGRPTSLWSAPLSTDGTSLGAPTRLVEASAGWQGRLIEGPAMIQARGRYYLFYGANAWNSSAAGIGYAICDTPIGPCADRMPDRPWHATQAPVVGPSGPSFFVDADGEQRMAFHAWDGCVGPPPCNRAAFFWHLAVGEGGPLLAP